MWMLAAVSYGLGVLTVLIILRSSRWLFRPSRANSPQSDATAPTGDAGTASASREIMPAGLTALAEVCADPFQSLNLGPRLIFALDEIRMARLRRRGGDAPFFAMTSDDLIKAAKLLNQIPMNVLQLHGEPDEDEDDEPIVLLDFDKSRSDFELPREYEGLPLMSVIQHFTPAWLKGAKAVAYEELMRVCQEQGLPTELAVWETGEEASVERTCLVVLYRLAASNRQSQIHGSGSPALPNPHTNNS